jgi:hypothetical protein
LYCLNYGINLAISTVTKKYILFAKKTSNFLDLVLEAKRHYGFTFPVTQINSSVSVSWVSGLIFTFKSDNMFSIKMVTFCKSANCTSSQNLLRFQNNEAPDKDARQIRAHLAVCEFCAAEVEFYAHYPQSDEKVSEVEIPLPLYELAEALLSNRHKDFSLLNKLLSESEVKI